MTDLSQFHRGSHARSGPWRGGFARLVRRLRDRRRVRSTLRELGALSDRSLHDIGFARDGRIARRAPAES